MITDYMDECGWVPQQDVAFVFDDKTAEDRSLEQLNTMVEKLRDVANDYGFDIRMWTAGHVIGFKKLPKESESIV